MLSEVQTINIPVKIGQVVYMDNYPWQDSIKKPPITLKIIGFE